MLVNRSQLILEAGSSPGPRRVVGNRHPSQLGQPLRQPYFFWLRNYSDPFCVILGVFTAVLDHLFDLTIYFTHHFTYIWALAWTPWAPL